MDAGTGTAQQIAESAPVSAFDRLRDKIPRADEEKPVGRKLEAVATAPSKRTAGRDLSPTGWNLPSRPRWQPKIRL